jgi:hypothetical protein
MSSGYSIHICYRQRRPGFTPRGHRQSGDCCEGPTEAPHGIPLDYPVIQSRDGQTWEPQCICSADSSGEAPEGRPDCLACENQWSDPPVNPSTEEPF